LEKVENYEIELGHPFMDPSLLYKFQMILLKANGNLKKVVKFEIKSCLTGGQWWPLKKK
jgi:hypothetical protein